MVDISGFTDYEEGSSIGFEPIPAGDYKATIIESGMKDTKNLSGRYLELTWQIIDGEQRNRRIWSRINLENQSAKAEQYAKAQLFCLRKATGVLQPRDSSELHNIPVRIRCQLKPNHLGELKTEIASYHPIAEGAQEKPASDAPWGR